MRRDELNQVNGDMANYLATQIGQENQEFTIEYLKSVFLASAATALFYMRRQAGLTQAQVAERMNTKQSAVARLEGDFDGGISLHRYVDFAFACGMVPHNITFAQLESAIDYTLDQARIPYTQGNYEEWLRTHSRFTLGPGVSEDRITTNFAIAGNTAQTGTTFSFEMNAGRVSGANIGIDASPTTIPTIQDDSWAQHKYFQPHLLRHLQSLPGGKLNQIAQRSNQIHQEVSA